MKQNRKLSLHALIIYRITLSEFVLAGYCRAEKLHLKSDCGLHLYQSAVIADECICCGKYGDHVRQ